jgi:hypothetical protein
MKATSTLFLALLATGDPGAFIRTQNTEESDMVKNSHYDEVQAEETIAHNHWVVSKDNVLSGHGLHKIPHVINVVPAADYDYATRQYRGPAVTI